MLKLVEKKFGVIKYNGLEKLFSCIIVLLFLMSCVKEQDRNVIIFNENHKNILESIIAYKNHSAEIIDNGDFWILKGFNAELALAMAGVARVKLDVISNNIANINTINIDGLPYVRKFVKITIENGIEIIEDMENFPKLVYDPTHQNAITTGELQGYVRHTNIIVNNEMLDMIEITRLYEVAIEYLKNKNYIIF